MNTDLNTEGEKNKNQIISLASPTMILVHRLLVVMTAVAEYCVALFAYSIIIYYKKRDFIII